MNLGHYKTDTPSCSCQTHVTCTVEAVGLPVLSSGTDCKNSSELLCKSVVVVSYYLFNGGLCYRPFGPCTAEV